MLRSTLPLMSGRRGARTCEGDAGIAAGGFEFLHELGAVVKCAIAGVSNATQGAYTMTMMQTTIVYDTHAAVLRLTETGMPEPQAVAVVREQSLLLEHNLATKADIELVKADIEALRQETKAGIEALRQETKAGIELVKADIEALRQETKADIELVKADIEALRQETKAGIEALRQETKAGIEALRQETKADIATAKNGIIMWVVGLNTAMVGLIIAAAKLL